jgi:solute carrier family 8 (sodium/calcium exchanger)
MGFVSANSLDMTKVMPIDTTPEEDDDGTTIEISFVTNKYVVMENVGTLSVAVELSIMGELSELPVPVCVQYFTKDGTATAPSDYLATQGELIFAAGELRKEVNITIIDDEEMEDDEQFYLLLASPRLMGESPAKVVARLGDLKQATVCILDDDNPGTLNFEQDVYNVTEDECSKTIDIVVHRKGGCAGKVSCHFFSEDDGAVGGKDFNSLEGVLEFEAGQATATIKCTILPRGRYEKEEMFRIILDKPTGGCDFAKNTDGGADSDICTVVIEGDPKAKDTIDNVAKMLRINWDKTQIGHKNWQEQFKHAIYVGGGDDEDDEEGGGSISVSDWVMHVLTVFWKVLFAFIPPADYCDGWISFFISLVMIGVVTIFIGDLASFLGCVMGCPDALTAITFVALGTSLPDTFASKTAATQDPYADASIGNVTGSNSVNVFLGIGISWSAGAFYWAGRTGGDWAKEYPGTIDETLKLMSLHPDGGVFAVRSGDLGFSVIVFCLCASVAIFVLMLRRRLGIGELGGPVVLKYVTACFFIFLWFLYVGLSAFKTFQSLKDDPCW